MRIVAGAFRGRRLNSPKSDRIRPTTDRTREALFSIIASRISGARVLDLFAGTGALGLEALSRGASHAVFVDQSAEAIRLLRANIALCGVEDRTRVLTGQVSQVLYHLSKKEEAFDLVFMDPPYSTGWIEKTIPLLGELAHPETLIVAEHHRKDQVAPEIGEWLKVKERRYGDSVISFFEKVSRNEKAENSNPSRERN
jgi:16S rRNA (guanine(966)-N(2))-methyltransferase RsmD